MSEDKGRRERYGDGPWLDEPDHVDFEHAGYPCILHRNDLGAWCGYVGVPEGHPWFGLDYDDVDASAHGGLTYAEACFGVICHPGEEPRWWLGFDCAHAFDACPASERAREKLFGKGGAFAGGVTYKDIAYVQNETEQLARQAQAASLTREPDEEQAP